MNAVLAEMPSGSTIKLLGSKLVIFRKSDMVLMLGTPWAYIGNILGVRHKLLPWAGDD